eukprot:GFKZ01002205.1.p1 GENE.GFKZ01002205.1~~GFKZ01002205.1.p1  ORF type:complete len:658 (+),score=58.07 GFKZ01002205.1:313-2286(+)
MKVVALLSGGKDSCYTLLRARQHGHSIIAIAHIQPPPHTPEPDSHMYQSVASSAVNTLAEAFQLPLFTVQTAAKALSTAMTYTPTKNDEVEDLVTLLAKVKDAHPDLQAVCAGALWSDYQRLRVESAASRLSLLSLAYLWRRDQKELIREMIEVGLDAIVVKVAGIGLNESHLGKSISEMLPTLLKLEQMYGSHVCGEGGEFETFVRWMPGMAQRVVIDRCSVVKHSEDPVAPVSYLQIDACHLEPPTKHQLALPAPSAPPVPGVFRQRDNDMVQLKPISIPSIPNQAVIPSCTSERVSLGTSGDFLYVVVRNPCEGKNGVTKAAQRLQTVLEENGETLGSVIYVQLFLKAVSGAKYAAANEGYTEVFGIPECTPPPSRSCVGVSPNNHGTVMEALVRRGRDKSPGKSVTLHVQSLSEWAPPCIGPYAQFIEEDGILHVCGVLPLYAPHASIPQHLDVRRQVQACAHNLSRTLEASRSCMEWLGLFVAYVTSPNLVRPVRDEMAATLSHQFSITIVLPVAELPKGGLVEIRPVGTITGEDLHKAESRLNSFEVQDDIETYIESLFCGRLGYSTVTLSGQSHVDDSKCAQCLHSAISNFAPFESSRSPLSIQVHALETASNKLDAALEMFFPDCALSVLRSPWMPQNAIMLCVATFAT